MRRNHTRKLLHARLVLGGLTWIAAACPAMAAAQASATDASAVTTSPLPPLPHGTRTVMGGFLRNLDPVRDQFQLKVFGGNAVKVLFDARTQFFLDGARVPLDRLQSNQRASVETVLDGTHIYAASVHILTKTPEGDCRGQVKSYDAASGLLTVQDSISHAPVTLQVQPATAVHRTGQPAFENARSGQADLIAGSLVEATFKPDSSGKAVAQEITVLATPGADFTFSGDITFLDLHTGTLALTDPRDERNYTVSFDPAALPGAGELHPGEHIIVHATFDGTRYNAVSLNKP